MQSSCDSALGWSFLFLCRFVYSVFVQVPCVDTHLLLGQCMRLLTLAQSDSGIQAFCMVGGSVYVGLLVQLSMNFY